MPRRLPASIKALIVSAFFVWAALSGAARADGPVRAVAAVDGDTVALHDGTLVRLIGINTPELGKDGAPDQPLAREAQQVLAGLIGGQAVSLEFEAQRHDHYGRLLAHLRLSDGSDPAEQLIAQGLASVIAIPPNTARFESYSRMEAEARASGRGIWGHSYYKAIPANRLTSAHAGFRFVTGRVERATRSRHGHYLWLTRDFALHIPHADARHFPWRPDQLAGRQVSARGWISARGNRLRLKIQHPGMLQVRDSGSVPKQSGVPLWNFWSAPFPA